MPVITAAMDFARTMSQVRTRQALADALEEACQRVGMRYFALSHHVDFTADTGLRLHNYPDGWEQWYDANRLGITDPVHRASHHAIGGFYWRDIPDLIPLLPSDALLLERGRRVGLGEGITVPAHIPGEAKGSCSFVAAKGETPPESILLWAQSVGGLAFGGARKILRGRKRPLARVSERQRECIALAGRGMTNKQIARMLGIGEQTVVEHFRAARARLEVNSRTELVISLLVSGELCIDDLTIVLPSRARKR
ncbi:LuxR family transcriptional regulator [Sphingomonas colocasiae]|uniref:LuxR family transcriptional regulator n=1 Tax=Sphingomonas colocasiae TaxID=1848973 RepID=A0ABS7PQL3_9SPHN|nr:LuxR family transcriptional regulator [Sphingomonas colocasiae]MBY8823264.1 LuxR family transcriptional regulator [Sphingomonas colocasiae]